MWTSDSEWMPDGYGQMVHMPTHRRSGCAFALVGIGIGFCLGALVAILWPQAFQDQENIDGKDKQQDD